MQGISWMSVLWATVAALLCHPVSAEEHWPGNYLYWPNEIVGHPRPCPKCVYYMMHETTDYQPYEAGRLFRVNPYGAYFFKTCDALADFVNNGILRPEVKLLRPFHVLIALRTVPYTAGIAHDELYGDGFVFMAPPYNPVPIKGPEWPSHWHTFRYESPRHLPYEAHRTAPLDAIEPHPYFKDAPTRVTCR